MSSVAILYPYMSRGTDKYIIRIAVGHVSNCNAIWRLCKLDIDLVHRSISVEIVEKRKARDQVLSYADNPYTRSTSCSIAET